MTTTTTPKTCPMSLAYVSTFPWDPTPCHALDNSTNFSDCCQTLFSLLGIALALRVRSTGLFGFSDFDISNSCIVEFKTILSAPPLFLMSNQFSTCLPWLQYMINVNSDYCAGILTVNDWYAKLGNSTVIDEACVGDLTDLTRCSNCVAATFEVSSRLVKIDGNTSHSSQCFYLTTAYTAGLVDTRGPEDRGVAVCVLGLAVESSLSSPRHSGYFSSAGYASVFGSVGLVLLVCAIVFFVLRARNRRQRLRIMTVYSSPSRLNTGGIWFGIEELEKATEGFAPSNLIGRGGFGVVYKGKLSDGSLVAVKMVLEPEAKGGEEEFCNEIGIISHLRHKNLVPLRGCCIKDVDTEQGSRQIYLVYDYMPNGCLDDHIFSSKAKNRLPLSWPMRKSIILDVAKGLMYLHYGVKPAIYHRDIKATNILLDAEMRARLADFGLAKQSCEGQSNLHTRIAGTLGYLAPEYALYGQLTEKSDVYSFGVLMLEILSSRRALEKAKGDSILITDWAWALVRKGRAEEVLDEALVTDNDGRPFSIETLKRFVHVGMLCAHATVGHRPTIYDAVKMLEGDVEVPEIANWPLPVVLGCVYSEHT